jgi:hypothetical protein
MEKFVILLCHDRSGSNLMRSILIQHPDIYIVPPVPIYELLLQVIERYRSLTDDRNWNELLADIVALTEANHFPLAYPITLAELTASAQGRARSLGQACRACFELMVRKSGRPHGGLKSGVQPEKLRSFVQQTGFTHAVFQYRDPRDVALSTVKAARNRSKPEDFVVKWLDWQRNARRVLGETLGRDRVIEVRYERLVSQPVEVLGEIWPFLDLPVPEQPLRFHAGGEQTAAAATSYMWENIAKPLMSENFEKFYEEWNETGVRRMEAALGAGLAEFGYQPAEPARFISADREPRPRDLSEADKSLTVKMEATFRAISDRLAAKVSQLMPDQPSA